ncbi:MAG: hypothetical protein MOGMAGMI_00566 [Candidatus Omnitrophica bacterium]|nr:hypothetical protein [Candidatus Omnitrophota bacterium]
MSLTEEWLIDGYNVYHAWRRSERALTLGDYLSRLADIASSPAPSGSARRFLVVLDGAGDDADLTPYCTDRCRVVRSGRVSADTCMERLIFELKAVRLLTLVSDDRAVRQLAIGAGCRCLGAAEFIAQQAAHRRERANDQETRRMLNENRFNRPFEKLL